MSILVTPETICTTRQLTKNLFSLKGTGLSPDITGAEPTRALAPEGSLSLNSSDAPAFSAASQMNAFNFNRTTIIETW